MGATALQALVPPYPTSSACNWSHLKGGLAPWGHQVCNPPASCSCPGNTLLLEQLVLLLWEGTGPWLPGSLRSLLPSGPGLTAHLSPVSWQELLLLSAGESQHWGKRLQDPRCTGRTIPGHSVPAAAIVRSKHQRRGRCGRAGDGPAESRWEHAYLHLPGEGREGGGRTAGFQFPSEEAGSSGTLPRLGHWGGWRVHCPALGCSLPSSASTIITVLSHHQISSMTEKQLSGRRPELPTDSLDSLQEQLSTTAQSPLLCTHSLWGRESTTNQETVPSWGGWDVLQPALAALTACSGSTTPHPQALGHNDQVSPHQVCSPTLPCLPAHGKSLSLGRKAIPGAACW